MSHILAVIPARRGSRGLRHKNVRKVAGIPLLVRAVQRCLASRRRGEHWSVVVSTDSPHYARLARRAGAEVPFLRPAALATDTARLIDAVQHTVDFVLARGTPVDVVLLVSAATPLVRSRDVRRALQLFHSSDGLAVAAVTRQQGPASWRFGLRQGRLVSRSRAPIGRRQQAAPEWVLCGALYAATPAWIHRHHRFVVSGRTLPLVLPRSRAIDVEDALDLAFADLVARRRSC